MTFGTALVICIGILCVTFLVACTLGAWLTVKKQNNVNEISKKILENRDKK